ncbi:MAG: hypothetical protein IPL55_01615 [Saprospiraceae bacterium]|jgi:uncharacterized protein YxjI|nr:hypothetical protein [Saprospiraceae bacterium]MBL0024942.1 hypothetical protein [Saprospiraceae bacterium]
MMVYPIEFEFKVMAFAPQFYVRDGDGREIAFVKQKLFKLKEDITVFENDSQQKESFRIKADRWLDWSAAYTFYNINGMESGKVRRKGAKSLWKATYEIFNKEDINDFKIEENNSFVKVMDALISEIPILGFLTGYVLNPKYNITDENGLEVAVFSKEPSFWGKKFLLRQIEEVSPEAEERIILSLMMMVLLERRRG